MVAMRRIRWAAPLVMALGIAGCQTTQGEIYGRGPVYGGPVYDGPVYDGPVYDGRVYDGRVYDGRVYEGRRYNNRRYDDRSYGHRGRRDGRNGGVHAPYEPRYDAWEADQRSHARERAIAEREGDIARAERRRERQRAEAYQRERDRAGAEQRRRDRQRQEAARERQRQEAARERQRQEAARERRRAKLSVRPEYEGFRKTGESDFALQRRIDQAERTARATGQRPDQVLRAQEDPSDSKK